MAKKPNAQRAQTQSDFANHDADKENIERIAAARAAENKAAGIGHNSEPSKEAMERSYNAIMAATLEIEAAGRIMQKARQELSAAEKTAKKDLGSKSWVDSVKKTIAKVRAAEKGGAGPQVTEHRQIGYVMKIMNVPLYHQFSMFALPDEPAPDESGVKVVSTAGAYLQGEAAYKNDEKPENNPFPANSDQYHSWMDGYTDRRQAALDGLGLGNDGGTSNGITDGSAAH